MNHLIFILIPLAYMHTPCTQDQLELLRPFYQNFQRHNSIFTPFEQIATADCEIADIKLPLNSLSYKLTIPELKDATCELSYVLLPMTPYVKNKIRMIHPFNRRFMSNFYTMLSSSMDNNCLVKVANEDEGTTYERFKWHFDKAQQAIKYKLLDSLVKGGHLWITMDFLEMENIEIPAGARTTPKRANSYKLLMKYFEKEVALHFRHSYHSHAKLAERLAKEDHEAIEFSLSLFFNPYKNTIMQNLLKSSESYLVYLESLIIEETIHLSTAYIDKNMPMLKRMYPDYNAEMKEALAEIINSPQIIEKLVKGFSSYTPKIEAKLYHLSANFLDKTKYAIKDILFSTKSCVFQIAQFFKIQKEYITPLFPEFIRLGAPECSYREHHDKNYPFKRFTLHYNLDYVECDFVIEMAFDRVIMPGEPSKNSENRKCEDIIMSKYTESRMLVPLHI